MIRKQHIPGLGLAAIVAVVAFLVESVVKNLTPVVVSPLVVAVVIGALLANLGVIPESFNDGLRFAARSLLRLGIVLLGLQLSFTHPLGTKKCDCNDHKNQNQTRCANFLYLGKRELQSKQNYAEAQQTSCSKA